MYIYIYIYIYIYVYIYIAYVGRINPAGDLPRLDEKAGLRVDSGAETGIQISRGLVRYALRKFVWRR